MSAVAPVAERGVEASEDYAARARLHRLFAGAFVEEPSASYLAALRSPESMAALHAMGARFDADFIEADGAGLQEALACEWTTLFASPGGIPPVESVRLTGRMQQEPFHGVREAYRRAGVRVAAGRFSVPDDQLGMELLFSAALLEAAEAASHRDDRAVHGQAVRALQRFWALHPGRWVRGYCTLVERTTLHSFYREMARLLRAFAEGEIESLGLRVEDVDKGRAHVPKAEVAIAVDPDEPECNACVTQGATVAPITFHR